MKKGGLKRLNSVIVWCREHHPPFRALLCIRYMLYDNLLKNIIWHVEQQNQVDRFMRTLNLSFRTQKHVLENASDKKIGRGVLYS